MQQTDVAMDTPDLAEIPAELPAPELTENAKTVLARRYLKKNGSGDPIEEPRDMFWRVARVIADNDSNYGAGAAQVAETARGFYDMMARGELSSVDEAIMDRASFWHNGNRLRGKGVRQTWFDKLPVKQVRLSTIHTSELLQELENRGVTKGTVMPSLDRVVESLELQRSIS